MKKMAIVEWGAPLGLVEAPTPAPQGREVLVKTQACGVCHSDVHVWEGYFDFGAKGRMRFADRGMKLPFVLGHEIVGTVVAKGPDAGDVEIGRSYIVYPWIGCGACPACARGDDLHCPQQRSFGLRCDGGYADHVVVHDAKYLVPYDGLKKELAATYACSGITAWSALKKTLPLQEDGWLCLIGAGGVGGTALQQAVSLLGAKTLVIDLDPAKRDAALKGGANAVLDGRAPDLVQQAMQITGGGAAAVIDFVGSGQTFASAIDMARRGGTVVLVGLFGGESAIPPLAITTKMLTIYGSYVGTLDDLKELVAFAQAGKLPATPIHPRRPEEATAALIELKNGAPRPGRSVLVYE